MRRRSRTNRCRWGLQADRSYFTAAVCGGRTTVRGRCDRASLDRAQRASAVPGSARRRARPGSGLSMMLERLELPRGQRLAAIHNSAKVGGRGGHFACDSPAGDRLRQHSMIPYVAIWASKSSRATAAVLDWAYRLATLAYDATLGGHPVDTSRRKVGDSSCSDSLALLVCGRTRTAAYKSATNGTSALSRFAIATRRRPV
jgi:hypothetical protein